MSAPSLHLALGEVLVARVDRLELRAINRHARLRQQAHLAAQLDEARADSSDRRAVVLAEIGDRLVVGCEPLEEPDHLEIAPRLALKPTARLDAVEIAVDVELQKRRRMVAWPSGCRGLYVLEAQFGEVESVNKGIDRTNSIALLNPVIESSRHSGNSVD